MCSRLRTGQVGHNRFQQLALLTAVQHNPTLFQQSVEAIIGVSFVVEEDGTTSDVRVVKAYSHPLFDDAVIAAAKTWKFKPATLEGKPIRVRRLVRVPFRLRTQ